MMAPANIGRSVLPGLRARGIAYLPTYLPAYLPTACMSLSSSAAQQLSSSQENLTVGALDLVIPPSVIVLFQLAWPFVSVGV